MFDAQDQQRQWEKRDVEESPIDEREDDRPADQDRATRQQREPAREQQVADHVDVAHQADQEVSGELLLVLGIVETMDVFEHVAANPYRCFAADPCDDELEPFLSEAHQRRYCEGECCERDHGLDADGAEVVGADEMVDDPGDRPRLEQFEPCHGEGEECGAEHRPAHPAQGWPERAEDASQLRR